MTIDALAGFRVMVGKELREAWRTARLPVTVLVFFIFGLVSSLLAKYTPEILSSVGDGIKISVPTPTLHDAIQQFIKNVEGDGLLVTILLAMGSVAREKERGTAAFVLTKPVSRLAFLAAKFSALLLTLGLGMVVAGATAYGYTTMLFGAPPVLPFVAMTLLVMLALAANMALTFLASTLTNSTVAAAVGGFAGFVLLSLLAIAPAIAPYTPTGLSALAQALVLGTPADHLMTAILANLSIVIGAFVIAWLAFIKQEQGAGMR